jgi:hypothetical protein
MQFYYLDHHPALLLRRRMQRRILRRRRWLRQQQLPVDYLIALLLRRMGRQWLWQWLWQRLRQFLLLIAIVFHHRKCELCSSDKNWEPALPALNFYREGIVTRKRETRLFPYQTPIQFLE